MSSRVIGNILYLIIVRTVGGKSCVREIALRIDDSGLVRGQNCGHLK